MKARFGKLVRFLSVLSFAVCLPGPRAVAQTLPNLNIQANAGQLQLTITGGTWGTAWQIQWADQLSRTSRWHHFKHCVLGETPWPLTDTALGFVTSRYYRALWAPSTNLVWIEPGTFTMGSPDGEQDRSDNEGPQTEVTITRGFWMGRCKVSQGEYQAMMGSNPSAFTGDPNLPVESVTWYEATNYCATLTAAEQAAGRLPAGYVYRLPTEAEWEYACRAGTTTRFYYGDDQDYSQLGNYAWYVANSGARTHPMGLTLPNAWGLHDMGGNVWDLCSDWWADNLPGGSVTDPTGPASGWLRVATGGAWDCPGGLCRSAVRGNDLRSARSANTGFRTVLAPAQP